MAPARRDRPAAACRPCPPRGLPPVPFPTSGEGPREMVEEGLPSQATSPGASGAQELGEARGTLGGTLPRRPRRGLTLLTPWPHASGFQAV